MVEGQGWHGDHKGHVEAATKGQAEQANNTPMAKQPTQKGTPEDRLDAIREELKKKYGRDYIWSAGGRLRTAKYLLEKMESYSIMDTGTLSNDAIEFHAPESDSTSLYDFKESFGWYFNRILIPKAMNVYDFLEKEAVPDVEWNKKRNKDYRSEVYLKYNYKQPLIDRINRIIREEIIPDLERLEKAEQEKESYLKGLQAGKKKFDFSYYDSWETGIQFLRVEGGVDKQTFTKLQREAGLEYHQPDEEMEERFKGWATRDIEKAWEILTQAGYYRPPKS